MAEPTLSDMVNAARRRVVVVAHCDDETMWCGGLMLRHPGDWTVIACSIPRADPIRAWKFHHACERLGARGYVLPFIETLAAEPLAGLEILDDELQPYDIVVTHNLAGEYGHRHHVDVHRRVARHPRDRMVSFGFGLSSERMITTVDLTDAEASRKGYALRAYDHVSANDSGIPKHQALIDRYAPRGYQLAVETFYWPAS